MLGVVLLCAATTASGMPPFGAPVASAAGCAVGTESDFNGDGLRDTAIADPEATVGGAEQAGLVRVVLAGGKGVFEISEAMPDMIAKPERGDRFGYALAAYDADADGCTDLVVGAPYEDVSKDGTTLPDAGAVYVIHGTSAGIGPGSKVDSYTQAGLDPEAVNEAYDWFGYALAAGKTSSDKPYLAVGVPGENIGDTADAGGVHYLQGSVRSRVTQSSPGVPGEPEAHDRFGYALSGTSRYLAVGAPGEAIGEETFAGAVAVFNHTIADGVPTALAGLDQDQPGVAGAAETGDGFGSAVSLVSYRPAGASSETDAMLAIGTPAEDIGDVADAGSVEVLQIAASGAYTEINAIDRSTADVEGAPVAGDFLGQRVALANMSPGAVGTAGTMRLAASAPGHDAGTATEAGAVQVFPALGPVGTGDRILTRGDGVLPGPAGKRDYAGMGLMGTSADLYVGVPYSKSGDEPRGVVYVVPWKNIFSGGTEPVRAYEPGAGGIPDAGRAFGAVLR